MSPERLQWRARQCLRYAHVASDAELLKFLLELSRELHREAEARLQQRGIGPLGAMPPDPMT